MKRNRPIFNTLKAAEALEGANFSAEQARQIVRVIQDSQENLATLDDLQESERNVKAAPTDEKRVEATVHTDEKRTAATADTNAERVKPTSKSTLTLAEKRDIFYVALGLSFGVIAFIALSAGLGWMLADIVYHLATR